MKLLFILSLGLSLAACSPPASNDEVTQLPPAAFAEKIKEDPSVIVLDVRTNAEMQTGIVEGATAMDFNGEGFAKSLEALDRDKTYLVYCASGMRSGKTVTKMKELGFKHVSALEGGLNAWRAAGFPVTNPQN